MKSFRQYLLPSIIASIFMSTYAIIDGIFIGQKIGDVGLSAINIAWPITSFLQCIGMAVGLSGGIYISSLLGKNKIEKSQKIKLTTIVLILIISIILGIGLFFSSRPILELFGAKDECLDYAHSYIKIILMGSSFQMLGVGLIPLLKNSGKVKFAMVASMTSISVNLVLDYVFIYCLSMDLQGAAYASVLAQVAAFLVCFIPYFKELKGVSFEGQTLKRIFLGAIAPFILNFSYSFIIILTNALCIEHGGNEAVAAYTLLSYLLYVIGALATGVADAIQPLFSFHYAKKEFDKNHTMLKYCFEISFGLCVLVSILFYFLTNPLKQLYNLSDTAGTIYVKALPYYLGGFLFVSIIKVICSYLYSVDDKIRANVLTLVEPLLLTPILYFLLSYLLGLTGLWIGYLIVQSLLFLIGIVLLYRNKRRREE